MAAALFLAACGPAQAPTQHVIIVTVTPAATAAAAITPGANTEPAPPGSTPLPLCGEGVTGPCQLVLGTPEPTEPTPPAPSPTVPPSPTPEVTATPAPTPTPPPAARNPNAPTITETTVTIDSYSWQEHLAYTQPGDPIYPYPRLDYDPFTFDPGIPQPQTFKALILENNFVRLTILPELGGRIYQWIDKLTGRELLYNNPVIKATGYGYRGWWLSLGGIEWSLPVEDHGFVEWLPWYYTSLLTPDTAAVIVSIDEEHTGLEAAIRIELDSTHSYFSLTPVLHNPAAQPLSFHFWFAAIASPAGDNRAGADLRFNVPVESMQVHSTEDQALPSVGETMTWPNYKGLDYSIYGNWKKFTSLFAAAGAREPHTGLYAPRSDQGFVRIFPPEVARGIKLFGPGDLPPFVWTDDDSSYVELWGGLTPNFSEKAVLASEDSLSWTEYWYPFHNIGNYVWANKDVALGVDDQTGFVTVRLYATSAQTTAVTLFVNKSPVARWEAVTPGPGPWQQSWTRTASGPIGITLTDSVGNIFARYGQTP